MDCFRGDVGFNALAGGTDRPAADLVRRTLGWSPLVNSTPAASSATCSRSIVVEVATVFPAQFISLTICV